MTIKIRLEEEKDHRRTEELAREAFWNLYMPGCNEHFIVHELRKHKDFIKDLSFVIEVDGEIQGAIYYSLSKIIAEDNSEHESITFGPVFIAPKLHRQGLARKLISHSIEKAKSMGYRAIIIGGYPYHYETYGFSGGKNYGIAMEDGQFYTGLLVLPLYEGALDNISGKIQFSEAFEVSEEAVEEFDKGFPHKEKQHQESQDEFERAVSMIDE